MATRTNITVKLNDGRYMTAYCHQGGYPSHMLTILTDNYNTYEKVLELISNGAMSSIGKYCNGGEGHSFDTPLPDQTIYYGRDRGEKDTGAVVKPLFKVNKNVKYHFLFKDGEWSYFRSFFRYFEDGQWFYVR